MAYKGFYINIIIRIILLFLGTFWLSLSIQNPHKIYTLITATAVTLLQIILLINYINKINRDLARFFSSLIDKDSSTQLNFENTGGALRELGKTLNEIGEIIRKSRIESEKQSKYFEFVVEHIPIGILTIDDSNKIIHVNKALKEILQIQTAYSLNNINSLNNELGKAISNIKPGEQKVFKLKIQSQFAQLLLRSTQFKFEEKNLKLVSLQNVKNELDENELISWQKLIRVLTHEIMNSITPISTLTLATKKCLTANDHQKDIQQITNETIQDVLTNTRLMEERSIGLQGFLEKYRSLTKIQALKISECDVQELFSKTISLFNDEIRKNNIEVKSHINPENISLEADQKLIEQILINLIKNSIESFKRDSSDKKILLHANINPQNRVIISISDNGTGISDEVIDQIFIPFFSTKEQGSGIGLSLARQIMRLHGGKISVQSIPNNATTFTLEF